MNIVRELRNKKGIQQKELALEIGVSNAAVSDWEHGKKDPTGDRLRKLADFFEVDELTVLGKGNRTQSSEPFVPADPKVAGVSETDQIIQHLLDRLDEIQPRSDEARILAKGVDRMAQEDREQVLNVVKTVFSKYSDYFEEKENNAP